MYESVDLNLTVNFAEILMFIVGSAGFLVVNTYLGYRLGYNGYKKYVKSNFGKFIQAERRQLLINGEQIGFIKGLEAGRLESRDQLRTTFITFLEEQVRDLKGAS